MNGKFNKIKRAIPESVSAPIGVYLVILIIAIILLIAGYCFCDSNSPEGEIAKNVGFSLLATFIASAIVAHQKARLLKMLVLAYLLLLSHRCLLI